MKGKRILSLLMAGAMLTGVLSGCNGGNKDDADKKLVIGGIGPTSGATATYGQAVRNGAKLAVEEINKAGGINGHQIEFLYEDDENNQEKAVNAYNTLMDQGMQILMGTVTSNPCIAVSEVAKDDNIFMLTPSGSASDCVKYDNAFRICFNDPNQGKEAARYIADNQMAEKVAVIYNKSDTYSTGIYEKFDAEAKEKNLEIVCVEAFTDSTATDFSAQLQKVKDSGADLLFLPIYYEAAAYVLTQAKQTGVDTKMFGCDGLDGVIGQLGDNSSVAEGVMLLTPFAADSKEEKSQKFTAAYKAAYNNDIPNQFAADAYDAIYTIKAAAEEGDVKPDMEVSDICEAMKAAMVKIKVDGVTGEMTWDAKGEVSKYPKAMMIQDGGYTAME